MEQKDIGGIDVPSHIFGLKHMGLPFFIYIVGIMAIAHLPQVSYFHSAGFLAVLIGTALICYMVGVNSGSILNTEAKE